MEGNSSQTHQPTQGEGSSLPLPPVSTHVVGDQSRSESRKSGAELPLGPSGRPTSHGRSGSVRGNSDETLGSQEGGNSASLPGLGQNQREVAQGSSTSSESPLPTTNEGTQGTATTTTLDPSTVELENDYTLSLALRGIPPSKSTILNGSTADSIQKQRLVQNRLVDDLPLHVKPLAFTINEKKLLALPCVSDATPSQPTLSNLLDAIAYIKDPSLYKDLPNRSARSCVKARGLSAEDTELLLKHGIIEHVSDPESVRGRIIFFVVPEWLKDRKRAIQHTVDVNSHLEPAPKVHFSKIADRIQFVHKGNFMGAADMKAYYHQFLLSDEVSDYMCFRAPNKHGRSDLVRFRRGMMGQSHMVYVAVSYTNRLLDFEHSNTTVDQHIDNVIFIGDTRENLVDQLRTFKARCDECDVTINEDLSSDDAIMSLIKTEDEWCGIYFDFAKKTARLTQKITDKVDLSWSLRKGWSNRGFAAHLGLLFYSSQILETPMSSFFPLFKFISAMSLSMHNADHTRWDEPLGEIPPAALNALEYWTRLAMINQPRHVVKRSAPTVLMAVDSCAEGWGYIAFDLLTGEMWSYGERWPAALQHSIPHKLRASTWTEPRGIFNAKQHALARIHTSNHPLRDVTRHFLIGSDNKAAVATLSRRHNKRSFDLNAIAARDYACFPNLPCTYVSVPGKKNWVADALSRPGTTKITMDDIMGFTVDDLRSLLGVRPDTGGNHPSGRVGSAE